MAQNIFYNNLLLKYFISKCHQYRKFILIFFFLGVGIGAFNAFKSPYANSYTGSLSYYISDDIIYIDEATILRYSDYGINVNTLYKIFLSLRNSNNENLDSSDNFMINTSRLFNVSEIFELNGEFFLKVELTSDNLINLKNQLFELNDKLKLRLADKMLRSIIKEKLSLQSDINSFKQDDLFKAEAEIKNYINVYGRNYKLEVSAAEEALRMAEYLEIDSKEFLNVFYSSEYNYNPFENIYNFDREEGNVEFKEKYSYLEGTKILNEKLVNLRKIKVEEKILNEQAYNELLLRKYFLQNQINLLNKNLDKLESLIPDINELNLMPNHNILIELGSPSLFSVLLIYIVMGGLLSIILSFCAILLREAIQITGNK